MDFLYAILSFMMLILGSEFLLNSTISLSIKLKLSRIVIGMTIVSLATSAPEFIVSLKAALEGFSDISFGNVVGSNITNIALVLGTTIIISPIVADKSFIKRDWLILMVISVLFYISICFDYKLNRYEGALFIVLLVMFLYFMVKNGNPKEIEEIDIREKDNLIKVLLLLLIGSVLLWSGSKLLIHSTVSIANHLGISERIISISVISIGTSIPELATSVMAALKKEKSISLGNLVGSNIFNILGVLGGVALIHPIYVQDKNTITQDGIWMLLISFLLLPMVLLPKRRVLGRYKGALLLGLYISFMYVLFS